MDENDIQQDGQSETPSVMEPIEPAESEEAPTLPELAPEQTPVGGEGLEETMTKKTQKQKRAARAKKNQAPKDSGKRAAKSKNVKPKAAKAAKAVKPSAKRARRNANAVFTATPGFALDGQLPVRGQCVAEALQRIGSGTAEDVSKKLKYEGKQDPLVLTSYFLRKMVTLGAASVA